MIQKYPDVDDDNKLRRRYTHKCYNAKKENIQCNLTYEDFVKLVRESNLVSSKLGFANGYNYVLARYNDKGPYEYGNCRFITQKENMAEQKTSEKQRLNGSKNISYYNKYIRPTIDPELLSEKIKKGMSTSKYYIERKRQAELKRLEFLKTADLSKVNEKNPQYGKFWITNGETNMLWKPSLGTLPQGFEKGRVMNNKR